MRRQLVLVLALVMLVACSEGERRNRGAAGEAPRTEPSEQSSPTGPTQYVLLVHPGWRLKEAVDYRKGLGALGRAEPDLDWYAEYDGPRVDRNDASFMIPAVRISGHTSSLKEHGDRLSSFRLVPETVGGRAALFTDASSGPQMLIVEQRANYSVALLSYDENVDLLDLAARLVSATEKRWIASGGTMLECVPFKQGCAGGAN